MLKILKNIIKKEEYVKAIEIGKHFDLSARAMNQIFLKINWAKKEGKNWNVTKLGLTNGAKQDFDNRNKINIILWNSKIVNNTFLIEAIKQPEKKVITKVKEDKINLMKENSELTKKMTTKEKKEKGDNYEIYLINHFKQFGYIVVPHGLEKGMNDRGIDIILRKGKENLFIQAKNWKADGRKINHIMIKAFVGEIAFFIEDNPAFGLSETKRYYITTHDILENNAKYFIEEHKEKISHLIMPMP